MLQFANPALLFGILLLAVPLIIHLLNRRRHKRRPWAAMEFLLRAYQRQRRRLRRENLLLLLLRCAIPILLALAIARPSLRDAGALGNLGGIAHHVLVFDRSYSMGVELPGGATPFERAKQLGIALVDGLDRRSGQKATLVLGGVRPTMPVRGDLSLNRVRDRIAAMPGPLDSGDDLTDALVQVAELVEESADAEVLVHLFTDLQVRAFGDDPFDPAGDEAPAERPTAEMFEDSARDALRRIAEGAGLTVFDVGGSTSGGTRDNIQVVDLRLGLPHAIASTGLPVHARLWNRTATTRDVQATLEIDGEQPLRTSIELEPGAEGEVTFQVTMRELGQRQLRVSIAGDDLAADNARHLVVPVRDRLRVLLVEGSNEQELDLRDATHIARILDPTRGSGPPELTPFALQTVDTISFLGGREPLQGFDLIVLANVPRLSEQAAAALEAAVEGGAGLLVMLGDRVDVESYNLHLHGSGDGLMPIQLVDTRGFAPGGDRQYGSEVLDADHPVFSDFAENVYFQIFEALPVYRFVHAILPETDDDTVAGARGVLAAVRDTSRSPLLAYRIHGGGKAAFLTSAISRRPDRWNGLDFEVVAFPLVHRLVHWLAQPSFDPFNVEVGASLAAETARRPFDLAVLLPDRAGSTRLPIGDEAQPLLGGRYALPPFSGTEFAGFYSVDMQLDIGGGQVAQRLTFAVNPPIDEGDLRYYSHAAARERLGIERIVTDVPTSGDATVQASFTDLGPLFLWLTVLAVLGEAALARLVSRRRS